MAFVINSLDLIDDGYKRSGLWGWTWVGRWVVIGFSFYDTSCVSLVHVNLCGWMAWVVSANTHPIQRVMLTRTSVQFP